MLLVNKIYDKLTILNNYLFLFKGVIMDIAIGLFTMLIISFFSITFYFVPAIIAGKRKTKNKIQVVVLNLLLGWTVLGWVVSIVMAFSPDILDNTKVNSTN